MTPTLKREYRDMLLEKLTPEERVNLRLTEREIERQVKEGTRQEPRNIRTDPCDVIKRRLAQRRYMDRKRYAREKRSRLST